MIRRAIALMMLLALPAAAGSLADLDTKNGFRDARFGMAPSELEGASKLQDQGSGHLEQWERRGDKLQIGGAKLFGIRYVFDRGRLSAVLIMASEDSDFRAMRDVLVEAYGPPDVHDGQEAWNGKKVLLLLRKESKLAAFYSQDLLREQEREKAKAAASDL